MAKSAEDVAQVVDALIRDFTADELTTSSWLQGRRTVLDAIRTFLRAHGYPRSVRERWELSLVPLYFQEANYDEINWLRRQADLGHLQTLFDVDLAVATGGKERGELSEQEYRRYVDESLKIAWRQGNGAVLDAALRREARGSRAVE